MSAFDQIRRSLTLSYSVCNLAFQRNSRRHAFFATYLGPSRHHYLQKVVGRTVNNKEIWVARLEVEISTPLLMTGLIWVVFCFKRAKWANFSNLVADETTLIGLKVVHASILLFTLLCYYFYKVVIVNIFSPLHLHAFKDSLYNFL